MQDVSWVRQLGRTGGARVIREGAGFTAPIARELGVSPATVSRWERGQRSPRSEVAERWALFAPTAREGGERRLEERTGRRARAASYALSTASESGGAPT